MSWKFYYSTDYTKCYIMVYVNTKRTGSGVHSVNLKKKIISHVMIEVPETDIRFVNCG